MAIKFNDIVKNYRSSCDKCISIIYEMPCYVDKDISKYLTSFGTPLYDLNVNNLLKIASEDNYTIEAKLNKIYIKFGMPKELEYTNWDDTTRKLEFEKLLITWIEDKLQISVEK